MRYNKEKLNKIAGWIQKYHDLLENLFGIPAKKAELIKNKKTLVSLSLNYNNIY